MCIFIINNYTAHLGYVLLADSKTGLLITVSWDFTATRLLNLQILREIANSPKKKKNPKTKPKIPLHSDNNKK